MGCPWPGQLLFISLSSNNFCRIRTIDFRWIRTRIIEIRENHHQVLGLEHYPLYPTHWSHTTASAKWSFRLPSILSNKPSSNPPRVFI